MRKLINAYESNPTLKNASKVVAYELKHPMSVCGLSWEELESLNTCKTATTLKGTN